jgi:serine/threonine-protein kinase HipA
MRSAEIRYKGRRAGRLVEDVEGYHFTYDVDYVNDPLSAPISVTLPLSKDPFHSNVLFPFFDGLIPEGWLLDVLLRNWKLNPRDRMGLLLTCCENCIGAVTVHSAGEAS